MHHMVFKKKLKSLLIRNGIDAKIEKGKLLIPKEQIPESKIILDGYFANETAKNNKKQEGLINVR